MKREKKKVSINPLWSTSVLEVYVIKGNFNWVQIKTKQPSCISHGTIKTIETTHKTYDQLCPWLHVNPDCVNKTDLKASDAQGNK